MTPAPQSRDHQLLEALMSTTCICGHPKQSKMSHCRTCYFTLPPIQRRALYRKIGEGYGEAYDASVRTLKELGRITGTA